MCNQFVDYLIKELSSHLSAMTVSVVQGLQLILGPICLSSLSLAKEVIFAASGTDFPTPCSFLQGTKKVDGKLDCP